MASLEIARPFAVRSDGLPTQSSQTDIHKEESATEFWIETEAKFEVKAKE
jgi:hypothetical protein